MDFFKRLLGTDDQRPAESPLPRRSRMERSPDEQAVERYRYLLRTAPPETIEEAHVEAFSKLTPEQRRMVLGELRASAPAAERDSAAFSDDSPRALARTATRAEMREPGALERTWNRMPAPAGMMGGGMMNTFMGAFAGVMIGNMVADAFLGDAGFDPSAVEGGDLGGDDAGSDGTFTEDSGSGFDDAGGFGGFDDFGGDFGGDF